jgi:hypothetical protein
MKRKSLLSVILMLVFSISSFAQLSQAGNQMLKSSMDAEYILSWDVAPTANTAQYRQEHYSVWISTVGNQPGDFTTMLFEETLLTTHTNWEYENREVGIDDYAGQTVYIAFRHHEITDMDRVVIDNVKLYLVSDNKKDEIIFFLEDFQGGIDDPLGEDWLPAGWLNIDNDGDGIKWYYGVRDEVEGSMRSESWNGDPLTPDNFLITPPVFLATIGVDEIAYDVPGIYPNPVKDHLNITNLERMDIIELMNTLGKVVKTIHLNGEERISVDVADLDKGIYFLGFYAGGKITDTKRVLKN